MSERFVYLILGSRGGGRSSVVSDLVDFGLDSSNESQVFISEDDAAHWESPLPIRHALCEQKRYLWKGADEGVIVEASSETVFVVADGMSDPADFVEAFLQLATRIGLRIGSDNNHCRLQSDTAGTKAASMVRLLYPFFRCGFTQ